MAAFVVREDDDAGVAWLTLNRPEKLNALSLELFGDLAAHLDRLEQDEVVRCVVIRGAGRAFCAGADLQVLGAGTVTDDPDMRSKTIARVAALPQPVLAVVHGYCFTGGLELALAADLILAADTAVFCDTHARLGLVPRWGMAARLPRRIGLSRAKRMAFTAERLSGADALAIGLCDWMEPEATLALRAKTIAAELALADPAAATQIKALYETAADLGLAEALVVERGWPTACRVKKDSYDTL
jgi:enoyl-CoA hydratase/carnithine racemase